MEMNKNDDDSKDESVAPHRKSMIGNVINEFTTRGVDTASDKLLFSTVMTPWVVSQWWRAFLIHVFPLPMIMFYYDWPEHHAFFMKIKSKEYHLRFRMVMIFNNHILPILLLISSVLTLFIDFGDVEKFSTCPKSVSNCRGSTFMGIYNPNDILKDSLFIPLSTFLVHRIFIACKYAVLSQDEYANYVNEQDPGKRARNMMLLNMLTTNSDLSDETCFEVSSYETEVALIKSRSGSYQREAFFVEIPREEGSVAAMNFKNWQALLLGKTHHHNISWKRVDPALTLKMIKRRIGDKEMFTVDVHHVLNAIVDWSEKLNFNAKFNDKLAFVVSLLVTLIPILSMTRIVDIETFADGDDGIMAIFVIILLCQAIINFSMIGTLTRYAIAIAEFFMKKAARAALLKDMIRTDDIDPFQEMRKVGITPSQKRVPHDTVERRRTSTKGGSQSAESAKNNYAGKVQICVRRNPNIARMPSISFNTSEKNDDVTALTGKSNNIMTWTLLRTCSKNLYQRKEIRLQIATNLNMWLSMFLGACLLYGYTSTLASMRPDEMNPGHGYIYISSPVSLQILILVAFFAFLTLLTILAGVELNSTYATHYLRLNAVMNINEVSADTRQRSRAYREKLKEISHAYKVSFRYVTALDAVNYSKLFGVGISSTLLTFYGTALTSVASMISVAWSAMIEAGYY